MRTKLTLTIFFVLAFPALQLPMTAAGQSASLNPPASIHVLTQQAELTATDEQQYSSLGSSVAISGETIVVGAPGIDSNGYVVPGAAYVYVRPAGGGWKNMTQVAELTASDGGSGPEYAFGSSVAINGNTIVVGSDFGEAYIYVEPAGGWTNMTETARLQNTNANSCFCGQVAIQGDTILVGSPDDSINAGSVFLFLKPVSGWQTTATPNAQLNESQPSLEDQFGGTVAIDGNTIVSQGIVGSQNLRGVFVFTEPNGGWKGKLTPTAILTSTNPLAFYIPVAVSGDTVISGIPSPYQQTPFVDVWVKPQTGWANMTETAELQDGQPDDNFGDEVAISDNLILTSAPNGTFGVGQGVAYAFVKPAAGWKSTSKPNAALTSSNGTRGDELGDSLAISGNTAVVGAPNGPKGSANGAAYVFGK
jgi:hypothetical protein